VHKAAQQLPSLGPTNSSCSDMNSSQATIAQCIHHHVNTLSSAKDGAVQLLDVCAHSSTSTDPFPPQNSHCHAQNSCSHRQPHQNACDAPSSAPKHVGWVTPQEHSTQLQGTLLCVASRCTHGASGSQHQEPSQAQQQHCHQGSACMLNCRCSGSGTRCGSSSRYRSCCACRGVTRAGASVRHCQSKLLHHLVAADRQLVGVVCPQCRCCPLTQASGTHLGSSIQPDGPTVDGLDVTGIVSICQLLAAICSSTRGGRAAAGSSVVGAEQGIMMHASHCHHV
jgi:hypothetical protein